MNRISSHKCANDIPKVKIVVVGDSGVGKSSLVHLITQDKPLYTSSWTIGCNVEVRLHEYREGTPSQKTYFVELWDIGGNNSHKNSRHVFLKPVHGIILVHDLSNRKSQQNLHPWLNEVLKCSKGDESSISRGATSFTTISQSPVFVVGTRLDQVSESRSGRLKTSEIAERCGAEEIFVNCLEHRYLAPGSNNAVKLSRFFDRVVECRTTSEKKETSTFSVQDRDTTHVRRTKTSSIITMPMG